MDCCTKLFLFTQTKIHVIYSAAEDKDNAGPQTASSHHRSLPGGRSSDWGFCIRLSRPLFREGVGGVLLEVQIRRVTNKKNHSTAAGSLRFKG